MSSTSHSSVSCCHMCGLKSAMAVFYTLHRKHYTLELCVSVCVLVLNIYGLAVFLRSSWIPLPLSLAPYLPSLSSSFPLSLVFLKKFFLVHSPINILLLCPSAEEQHRATPTHLKHLIIKPPASKCFLLSWLEIWTYRNFRTISKIFNLLILAYLFYILLFNLHE